MRCRNVSTCYTLAPAASLSHIGCLDCFARQAAIPEWTPTGIALLRQSRAARLRNRCSIGAAIHRQKKARKIVNWKRMEGIELAAIASLERFKVILPRSMSGIECCSSLDHEYQLGSRRAAPTGICLRRRALCQLRAALHRRPSEQVCGAGQFSNPLVDCTRLPENATATGLRGSVFSQP